MNDNPIGIFDSGVGGISILSEIKKILPNENYIYFGDTANNPYGEKTQMELELITKSISKFLYHKGAKIIVIACNTASTSSYEILKDYMDIPVVGVIESGLEAAIEVSENKNISAICTKYTCEKEAFLKALENRHPELSKDYKITHIYGGVIANRVEQGWDKNPENNEILKKIMEDVPKDSDTLILGCTHYPYIQDEFEKYFKGNIVDPGKKLAKKVKEFLEEKDLLSKNNKGKITYYSTGDVENFSRIASKFMPIDWKKVKEINL